MASILDSKMDDPENLIQAIELRPCIWDTFCTDYYDRLKTRTAWEEIAAQFYPEFPNLNDSERSSIVLLVQRKWRNMRDSYVKDLRLMLSKRKNAKRRKYIFFDRLAFLRRSVEVKMSKGSIFVEKSANGSDNSQSDEDSYAFANLSDAEMIDPKALIAVVEDSPCLWDASCEDYHDRVLTKEAWLHICRTFYPHYDDLQESDRINLLGSVQKKWRHLRDCFVKDWKALNESKSRGIRLRRRKHMYYDNLVFLAKSCEWKTKNNPHASILEDSFDEMSCQDYDAAFGGSELFGEEEVQEPQEFVEVEKKFNPNELQTARADVEQKYYPICSISNSPKQDVPQEHPPPVISEQPLTKEITKEVTMFTISKDSSKEPQASKRSGSNLPITTSSQNQSAPESLFVGNSRAVEDMNKFANEAAERTMDEDIAFFFSLLPTVRRFDEDTKLEFRIEVIKAIQKMKHQQKMKSPEK